MTQERYSITVDPPDSLGDQLFQQYLRNALADYGPFIGLEHHPAKDGIVVTSIRKEPDMARLRGRTITIKFDLPGDIDPDEIAGFFYDALTDHPKSLKTDDPMKAGIKVRKITYNGEAYEV